MKNKKIILPKELLSELIKFIPLNLKWVQIRVSLTFDIIILKHQRKLFKILKEDIESLLDQIVKTFEGVVSEKYLDLQFLKHLISRIEDFPSMVEAFTESSPQIPMPNYVWPEFAVYLTDKQLKKCFGDRKKALIGIFNDFLEIFRPISPHAVPDLKEWKRFLQVMLSAAKKVKLYADTNCDKEEEA
ncbi:hypothetical protein ACQ4LE_004204 [Meloidogyne hapla]